MGKRRIAALLVLFAIASLAVARSAAAQGRVNQDLSGPGWTLWQDQDASWQNDTLFPPSTPLSQIPANPPTGGWDRLTQAAGMPVSVPGTVEEYTLGGAGPNAVKPGVSWWCRAVKIPRFSPGKRVLITFGGARLRAEVYLDHRLVGYNIVEDTPFDVDVTGAVKPGETAQLAVRVTNPGGSSTWIDFLPVNWGSVRLPGSHSFGGITGSVALSILDSASIDDLYVQNTPDPHTVNAIVTVRNTTSTLVTRDLAVTVSDNRAPFPAIYRKVIQGIALAPGATTQSFKITVPNARLWDLDHPNLYACHALLQSKSVTTDSDARVFGFRWFAPVGQGTNAVFRLNGKRIVLRTAISWGYWPVTGDVALPEYARKQIADAKAFGLNMLNFHRCVGQPVVLNDADAMGLLYFEEPGGYVAAGTDPLGQAVAREKLLRMIKRDRSHPSLIIYNMINEQWDINGADKDAALFGVHQADLRDAHALDPSRTIVYTSAFARPDVEEKDKMHALPFDSRITFSGWWDSHRAVGPHEGTWQPSSYQSPTQHYGYTDDTREFAYRGEEGAISTPPRLEKISAEIAQAQTPGWDGTVYQAWEKAVGDFLDRKGLRDPFPTVDDWTTALGTMSLENQGRSIEEERICDANDGYAINGWESITNEDHSGVVDEYRNPKADPGILAYYNQPEYLAIMVRDHKVVQTPDHVVADLYAINEHGLSGAYRLHLHVLDPTGKPVFATSMPVTLTGGAVYGELLKEAVSLPITGPTGSYQITATLTDKTGAIVSRGHDQVLGVDWKSTAILGHGALYESGSAMHDFLKDRKGMDVPAYSDKLGPLDWIAVSQPITNTPVIIPSEQLRDLTGKTPGLTATFFSDESLTQPIGQRIDPKIDFVWNAASPDPSVGRVNTYGVRWEGTLIAPVSGEYVFQTVSDDGVRLFIDNKQIIDDWKIQPATASTAKVTLTAGQSYPIKVEYYQATGGAEVHLSWAVPAEASAGAADQLIARAQRDGTTLVILDHADQWMEKIAPLAGATDRGAFTVGDTWVGGQYFVRSHPLFQGLPVNQGMNWPYADVLGGTRTALGIEGEQLVSGAYQSVPFALGTAVGIVHCGKGRVVFSTLDILPHLNSDKAQSEVTRKLFCNFLAYGGQH